MFFGFSFLHILFLHIFCNLCKIHLFCFSHFFSNLLSSTNIENFLSSVFSHCIALFLQLEFVSTFLKMELTLSNYWSFGLKWFLFWAFFSYQRTKNFIADSHLFDVVRELSFCKSKSWPIFLQLCMIGIVISIWLRFKFPSPNNFSFLFMIKATSIWFISIFCVQLAGPWRFFLACYVFLDLWVRSTKGFM